MNKNEIIMYKKTYIFSKNEYVCDITSLLNMFSSEKFIGRRHYLYKASSFGGTITYAIRVPGRTVGLLCTDLNNIIVSCMVEDFDMVNDYIQYPEFINDLLKKAIGYKLIFDE